MLEQIADLIDNGFFYDTDEDGNASITDLTGTRVAFPKYVEREPFFQHASLEINQRADNIKGHHFKIGNFHCFISLWVRCVA